MAGLLPPKEADIPAVAALGQGEPLGAQGHWGAQGTQGHWGLWGSDWAAALCPSPRDALCPFPPRTAHFPPPPRAAFPGPPRAGPPGFPGQTSPKGRELGPREALFLSSFPESAAGEKLAHQTPIPPDSEDGSPLSPTSPLALPSSPLGTAASPATPHAGPEPHAAPRAVPDQEHLPSLCLPPLPAGTPCTLRLALDQGCPPEAVAAHVASMRRVLERGLCTCSSGTGAPASLAPGEDCSGPERTEPGSGPTEAAWRQHPFTVRLGDVFRVHRELGRGHMGVVRLCQEKATGRRFACKTVGKAALQSGEDVDELCGEILVLLHLHKQRSGPHQEHIVALKELLEDEGAVHLVLQYCSGGDLFTHITSKGQLSEGESAHILRQLVLAVQGIHVSGILHRDLKPENILLTGKEDCVKRFPWGHKGMPTVKVADFGLAKKIGPGGRVEGIVGSPFYIAPEVILGAGSREASDTWSLGVILYTCLSGYLPFCGRTNAEVFRAVVQAQPDLHKSALSHASWAAKDLISSMLEKNPGRRASLDHVLTHPWMELSS